MGIAVSVALVSSIYNGSILNPHFINLLCTAIDD